MAEKIKISCPSGLETGFMSVEELLRYARKLDGFRLSAILDD
jgi:hypothetical protein